MTENKLDRAFAYMYFPMLHTRSGDLNPGLRFLSSPDEEKNMRKLLALIALAMLVLAFGCQQQNAGNAPAVPVMPTQAELDSIRAVLEKAQMDYAQDRKSVV